MAGQWGGLFTGCLSSIKGNPTIKVKRNVILIRLAGKSIFLTFFCLLLGGCNDGIAWTATDISGLMPNLEMDLVNDDGKAVDQSDYLGKTNIVFFGYTFCPDICPTTLAKIRQSLLKLEEDQRSQVNVLFISVDPKRDTPEHLKQYIGSFGPEFTGLTGNQEQLREMVKKYRVTYGYGQPDEDGNYDVSHSSAIFVFDRKGAVRLLAKDTIDYEAFANDLAKLMEIT